MQMGGEGIENLFMNVILGKKLKYTFPCNFIGAWVNQNLGYNLVR